MNDVYIRQAEAIERLTKEIESLKSTHAAEVAKLREALEKYADKDNWGYLDDSGCVKGRGESEEHCELGTEIAREALKNIGH